MQKTSYSDRLIIDQAAFAGQYMQYVSRIADPDLSSVITVEIPSFIDSEICRTVESFRSAAAAPSRLRFTICLQDDDPGTLSRLAAMPDVSVKHIPADKAPGLCAARYECSLMAGTDGYVLHTDSHMRAAKYWDVALIDMLSMCPSDKPLLSGYPLNYTEYYDRDVSDGIFTSGLMGRMVFIGTALNFEKSGAIRFRGLGRRGASAPVRGMFISGGFVFAKADLDTEVPPDPMMFFVADEISMDIRYWTHGYDVYHPHFMPLWHLYDRAGVEPGKQVRRFNDSSCEYNFRRDSEEYRMRVLETLIHDDRTYSGPGTGYGAGTERTVESFCMMSGIDFRRHAFREFATTGNFFGEHNDSDMAWHCFMPYGDSVRDIGFDDMDLPVFEDSVTRLQDRTIFLLMIAPSQNVARNTAMSLMYQSDCRKRIHPCIVCPDACTELADVFDGIDYTVIRSGAVWDPASFMSLGQSAYAGEDYVLMLYAPALFVWHFDTMLIKDLDRAGSRAVISGSLPTAPSVSIKELWHGCFDMPYLTGDGTDMVQGVGIISSGFYFAPGSFVRDIPYPSDLYRSGQDIFLSLAAYCAGYRVFDPGTAYVLSDGTVPLVPCLDPAGQGRKLMDLIHGRHGSVRSDEHDAVFFMHGIGASCDLPACIDAMLHGRQGISRLNPVPGRSLALIVPVLDCASVLGRFFRAVIPYLSDTVTLFIADDASSDGSPDIIREFAGMSRHIVPFYFERRLSTGEVRNYLIRLVPQSQFSHVAFCDADDIPDIGVISRLALSGGDAPFIFMDYEAVNPDTFDTSVCVQPHDLPVPYKKAPCVWNGIYRLDFINRNNIEFAPVCNGEDLAFTWQCLVADTVNHGLYVKSEPVTQYLYSGHARDSRSYSDLIKAFRFLADALSSYSCPVPWDDIVSAMKLHVSQFYASNEASAGLLPGTVSYVESLAAKHH